jgi:hypothetical protein
VRGSGPLVERSEVEFEDLSIEHIDQLLLRGWLSPDAAGYFRMLLECVGERYGFTAEEVRKMSVREAMSLEPGTFRTLDGFDEEGVGNS